MKARIIVVLCLCLGVAHAQEVITLYPGQVPGSEEWDWQEAEMYSHMWQTRVVYNVSVPTITAYLPAPKRANGTAVVVCPGGGFHALSIDSEGIEVAKWLSKEGVAAFVLKYRLVKTETADPVKELSLKMTDRRKFDADNAQLIPLAVRDGLEAIKFLRRRSRRFNINPERIGIMGFSAGGTIAVGTTLEGQGDSRPDFVASIYAYLPPHMQAKQVPANAPPMFLAAATDDQLGLAPHSVLLYNLWLGAGRSVALHLFAAGGHGFGMRRQGLPADSWSERFRDWLEFQGLLRPPVPVTPLKSGRPSR